MGAVRSLSVDSVYLYSGGDDFTVRQWTTSTWVISEFIGHAGRVNNLQLESFNLFSGSQDKDVRIWDTRSGFNSRTIAGKLIPLMSYLKHQISLMSYNYYRIRSLSERLLGCNHSPRSMEILWLYMLVSFPF